MTVVYYHDGAAVRLDNDSLVKPIQESTAGPDWRRRRRVGRIAVYSAQGSMLSHAHMLLSSRWLAFVLKSSTATPLGVFRP
jgi:hypothetical protein